MAKITKEMAIITKAQADAIENAFASAKTSQQILAAYTCGHADPRLAAMDFDTLAAALYVGYEIQQEPADILAKVLEELEALKEYVDAKVQHYRGGSDNYPQIALAKKVSYTRVQERLNEILRKVGIE